MMMRLIRVVLSFFKLTSIHLIKTPVCIFSVGSVLLVRTGSNASAHGTARSVEDETWNDRRNANRNPEWWGDFSQLQN